MRLSMFSMKRLFWAFAVVVAVMTLGLLVSGKQSLYGQAANKPIPDLRGPWGAFFPNVCHVPNVWEPDAEPLPACGRPDDTGTNLVVTHQSGRIFLGRHETARDRFTGYIAPDGTVSIHYFSPSEHEREHLFFTGTLAIEKGKYVVSGYAHGFSELPMPPQPCPQQSCPAYPPYIHTLEMYLTKR